MGGSGGGLFEKCECSKTTCFSKEGPRGANDKIKNGGFRALGVRGGLLDALGDILGHQGRAPEGVRTTKGGLGKGLGSSQKCKKHVFLSPWRSDAHISMGF